MSRPSLAPTLGILALAVASLAGCDRPRDRVQRVPAERIVLITIDTLRADFVSAYGSGNADTPHLDSLSETGVRFSAAISPAPLTLPTHASILTGLDPPHHGVRDNTTFALPEDLVTLPEILTRSGWATGAFVGSFILDRQHGLARGFDVYDDAMGVQGERGVYGIPERPAQRVVDAALDWLRNAPDHFFLWVHFFDPHAPWEGPASAAPRARYAGEIERTDFQVGRLVEAVRARWPEAGTLFVATSDHGESLGEHGEGTHSLGIYDATQRVPLILSGAGLPGGTVVDAVVGLADLAPTLLTLAGLPSPPELDGRDLTPLTAGEPDPGQLAYLETLAPRLAYGWSPLFGLRSSDFKYVRAPRPELYDLRNDPGELENLAQARPELAKRFDAMLSERLTNTRVERFGKTPGLEEQRMLEELGYAVPRRGWTAEDLERVDGPNPIDQMEVRETMQQVIAAKLAGEPQRALDLLEGLDTEALEIALFAASTNLELGATGKAERAARRAIELEPMSYEAHLILGHALLARDHLSRAEAAFREAGRLQPELAAPWLGLGLAAERGGDRDRAVVHYEQAASVRIPSLEPIWRLAALWIEANRAGEAEALLAQLPPDELSSPYAAERIARAEAAAGMPMDARKRIEAALADHPESRLLRRARRSLRRIPGAATGP